MASGGTAYVRGRGNEGRGREIGSWLVIPANHYLVRFSSEVKRAKLLAE